MYNISIILILTGSGIMVFATPFYLVSGAILIFNKNILKYNREITNVINFYILGFIILFCILAFFINIFIIFIYFLILSLNSITFYNLGEKYKNDVEIINNIKLPLNITVIGIYIQMFGFLIMIFPYLPYILAK